LKKERKQPPIPPERSETIRQGIISILDGRPHSAKEISAAVMISEREVYGHLEHILRSYRRDHTLKIEPAQCKKCGFTFRKREKLKKPGKCPVCRGESIMEPLFSIGQRG
jgi:predicted Zn-ribbon and HTH transcriptional regulator